MDGGLRHRYLPGSDHCNTTLFRALGNEHQGGLEMPDRTINITTAMMRQITDYVMGKFQNAEGDTEGARKAKQKCRYEVEHYCRQLYKELKPKWRK